ncbi:MAG: hypothetical protein ACOYJ8_03395 [Patescibacteria group bacterium]|jgi:hypothetical protein
MSSQTNSLAKEGVRIYRGLREDTYNRVVIRVSEHNEAALPLVVTAALIMGYRVFFNPIRGETNDLPNQKGLKKDWYTKHLAWYLVPPSIDQIMACLTRNNLPTSVARVLAKTKRLVAGADEIVIKKEYVPEKSVLN